MEGGSKGKRNELTQSRLNVKISPFYQFFQAEEPEPVPGMEGAPLGLWGRGGGPGKAASYAGVTRWKKIERWTV